MKLNTAFAPLTSRRNLLKFGAATAAVGTGWVVGCDAPLFPSTGGESANPPAEALHGAQIPQFVSPLPTYAGQRVRGTDLRVSMEEFQQKVLPDSCYSGPYSDGTWLRGYAADGRPARWPGVTVEAVRGIPTTIRYVNNLPLHSQLSESLVIDQTIHWANPGGGPMSFQPYDGAIPTVVHLHGGENQSTSDGVPEGWFTSTGLRGKGYTTVAPAGPGSAVYHYPNRQQATTLWFHDHALGITRINVFAGLAAFYLLRDAYDTGRADNPLRLPAGDYEVELLIQDRQFDVNGQLYWPDSKARPSLVNDAPANPKIHPYWIPEFFGDVMCVNGRSWPYLEVEPRRYRFRFLNGSNARFLRMGLVEALASGAVGSATGPAMYQIGTDGGLLDTPVKLPGRAEPVSTGTPAPTTRLFLAPSERADVIIDFSHLAGKTLTLTNDAQVPFPSGNALNSSNPTYPTRNVMQFRVTLPLRSPDTSYNPATGARLRGGGGEPAIVRLADPATGAVAAGVTVHKKRQLVLFEYESPNANGGNTKEMPVIDLVNNSKWSGHRDGGGDPAIPGSVPDQYGQGLRITELPRVGSTEIWEFLNLTTDAHPIHLHLVQFQLLNRQAVRKPGNPPTYIEAYTEAFGGGTFNGETADGSWGPFDYPRGTVIPGYGPPRDYFAKNADGALGGNPAFSPYLTGPVLPPNPSEAGWKDTVKVFPGFVNRFIIRWAPQATPVSGVHPGKNLYRFDPTEGPGYMVHCHILDHEDNEMMRPYIPVS